MPSLRILVRFTSSILSFTTICSADLVSACKASISRCSRSRSASFAWRIDCEFAVSVAMGRGKAIGAGGCAARGRTATGSSADARLTGPKSAAAAIPAQTHKINALPQSSRMHTATVLHDPHCFDGRLARRSPRRRILAWQATNKRDVIATTHHGLAVIRRSLRVATTMPAMPASTRQTPLGSGAAWARRAEAVPSCDPKFARQMA